jgi:hypothetical protein
MIPASVMAKGERVALEYLLESTPLGAFFEREEVRRAIAEDILLEQFKPFVFTALFLDAESLQTSWKVSRPDAYTLAKRLTEGDLTSYEGTSPETYAQRALLRMTAYRKVDIWWCGNEIFTPHESLGAEPYFTITLPGYESRPVKIGAVQSMLYASDPKKDAVALELIQKGALTAPIEKALFPLLPPEGTTAPSEWEDLQAILKVAESFRAFDRTHKLPVFPKTVLADPLALPEGFVARVASDAVFWKNLYALGISPILSLPEADYLKTKTHSVAALASQREKLLDFLSRSIRFENIPAH